ncbi:MAG: IS21-like element helper ATPase IstB [Patescibacteria group bacterium]
MGKKLVTKYAFPSGTQTEKISHALKFLNLDASATSFEYLAEKIQGSHGTVLDFLEQLLEIEFAQKEDSRVESRIQRAKLFPIKTLQDFDFAYQPSINQPQINNLASCRYITQGKNVVILGPPGVGKTHLAMALGYEAIQKGHSTRCMKLNECLTAVNSSSDSATERLFRVLVAPELLILDDIEYYDTDDNTGQILFDVLRHRNENNTSTIITSNKNPITWLSLFGTDPVKTGSLLDRIMDHSKLFPINIRGNSYRVPKPAVLAPITEELPKETDATSSLRKPFQSVFAHLKR